jgi:hypothetical protein
MWKSLRRFPANHLTKQCEARGLGLLLFSSHPRPHSEEDNPQPSLALAFSLCDPIPARYLSSSGLVEMNLQQDADTS